MRISDWSSDVCSSDLQERQAPMSQLSGPVSRFYVSQRLRLHYVDWGNEDKPPLLLVHGGRDHCRNWDWVAQSLRDRYHIIAPDLRGHGDSPWIDRKSTRLNSSP